MLTDEEYHRLLDMAPARVEDGKFNAKLNATDKRHAYALLRYGFSQRVVAAVFKLHRQTVATLSREGTHLYADVKNEYKEIGHEFFLKKYLRPDLIDRANRFKVMRSDELQEMAATGKKANKKEGTHVHKKVEFSIVWIDAESCWGVIEPGDPEPILPSGYDGSTSTTLYDGLIACINENGAIYAL